MIYKNLKQTMRLTAKWIYPVSSPPIQNGEIVIKNGKIVEIGKLAKKNLHPFDQEIELSSHILMPGLINTHTHLELSALKNKIKKPLQFTDWIKDVIRFTVNSDNDTVTASVNYGLNELIKNGTCTIADISTTGHSQTVLSKKTIRGIVFNEVIGFQKKDAAMKGEEAERNVVTRKETDLIKTGFSPHSVYSVSPVLIKAISEKAKKYNLPVSIHIAETEAENRFLQSRDGEFKDLLFHLNKWDDKWEPPDCSSVVYLDKLNTLNKTIAVHCNYASPNDIDILKKRDTFVVFCPLSNSWFGRQYPYPLPIFQKKGICVSIGTDSLASNDELNIFKEMQEVRRLFPEMNAESIIEMATINAAQTLSFEHLTGTLEVGKKADIIALEDNKIEAVEDIPEFIVSANPTVYMTMIDGSIVFCNA